MEHSKVMRIYKQTLKNGKLTYAEMEKIIDNMWSITIIAENKKGQDLRVLKYLAFQVELQLLVNLKSSL